MSFIWPVMLLSLLFIPLFVVLYLRIQRRRRRLAASYGDLGPGLPGRRPGMRRHVPPGILLFGLALLLVSLARPRMVVNVPRIEGTVILTFDVSGSMAADDLPPTRLEAAKAAAIEFVQHQPSSVRIGIVAFSDNGFIVQAPTDDQEAILSTINRLRPERGTSVANGIAAALDVIFSPEEEQAPNQYSNLTPAPPPTPTPVPPGTTAPAVIVLLTDGENNEDPDPLEAAQAAADRGVRVYTVGIGSPAGTTLHVNGFLVHTQLNEAILQQISELTGAEYYNAQSEQDLQSIYQQLDRQLVIKPEEMEVTAMLAGASILAMLIGGALSLLWFSRLP